MSLINKVLSDLQQRGSRMPDALANAVRPVPVRPGWTRPARLISGAVAVLAVAGGALWVALNQEPTPAVTAVPAKPAPKPAKQHAALPASAVQPQSAVAANVIAGAASAVPAPLAGNASAVHPAAAPAAPTLQVAQQEGPAAQAKPHAHPSDKPTKKSVTQRAPAETATHKGAPIKRVSPQQQAEGEYNQAVVLIQQDRKDAARQHLETALQLNPAHRQARLALAGLLAENKHFDEAESVLQDGLRTDPKQLDYGMLLARLQVERNALPQALDTLQKMQPYAREQGNYQAFLAAVLQRLNRHEEAVTHYKTALRGAPNSGVWLMGMGISLQALKRNEEAREAYRLAIESHSLNAELQDFVGRRLKAL